MATGLVGAGDPAGAGDDAGVDDEADAARRPLTEHARSDVALDQLGSGREVGVRERHGLRRQRPGRRVVSDRCRGRPGPRSPAARECRRGGAASTRRFFRRVGGGPLAVGPAQVLAGVQQVDERLDRGRVWSVLDMRSGQVVERLRRRGRHADRLDIGRVVARRAAHIGVLADVDRSEELLAGRATHRPRHGRDDHVGQAEAFERGDVGVAMARVLSAATRRRRCRSCRSPSSRTPAHGAVRRAAGPRRGTSSGSGRSPAGGPGTTSRGLSRAA